LVISSIGKSKYSNSDNDLSSVDETLKMECYGSSKPIFSLLSYIQNEKNKQKNTSFSLPSEYTSPISVLKWSQTGRYLLAGNCNGLVCFYF
jgi:hypothetical protein